MNDIVRSIESDLEKSANPEQGEKVAGYMKTSDLQFLGVRLPNIQKIVKKHIKGIEIDTLVPIAVDLWKNQVFEMRRAAIDVMMVYAKKGDVQRGLTVVDEFIDDIDTWSLMDPLGSPVLGELLRRDASVEKRFKEWRRSENFWRRRATILPYLYLSLKKSYTPENDTRILDAMKPHLGDKEFFVGKAVGWVLRELSKRNPEIVRDFIAEHREKMTTLSIREGSKKL